MFFNFNRLDVLMLPFSSAMRPTKSNDHDDDLEEDDNEEEIEETEND